MKNYSYGKQSICWRDIWAVIRVLRSAWLTQGPTVQKFEEDLCKLTGAKYAVALANGTAALHLAALVLELTPGDEVITSPNTFLASANCVLYAGATVKFADIDQQTACISAQEIKKQITPKTKAIIPVHFAGQPCDMDAISKIAKEYKLKIIEDAAHAIGSFYKDEPIGNCRYSDMTIFSFHPVKTITTGEGGAILTNNKELYERLLVLRTHGMVKDPQIMKKNDGPWYYEMQQLGFNYRLTDIQAALGITQLKRLTEFCQRRRAIVSLYVRGFANDPRFGLLTEKDYAKSCWHLCPLLIDFSIVKKTKKEIIDELKKHNIYLQVHYIPVHTQPYYQQLGFKPGDYPAAEKYYSQSISLPLYPALSDKDIQKIIAVIKKVIV